MQWTMRSKPLPQTSSLLTPEQDRLDLTWRFLPVCMHEYPFELVLFVFMLSVTAAGCQWEAQAVILGCYAVTTDFIGTYYSANNGLVYDCIGSYIAIFDPATIVGCRLLERNTYSRFTCHQSSVLPPPHIQSFYASQCTLILTPLSSPCRSRFSWVGSTYAASEMPRWINGWCLTCMAKRIHPRAFSEYRSLFPAIVFGWCDTLN
ncbi:hypothetical protein V8B97DRAFT_1922115 [Scleroderma yunnanense]